MSWNYIHHSQKPPLTGAPTQARHAPHRPVAHSPGLTRVLVVDDDESIRADFARQLDSIQSMQVVATVPDGTSAIAFVRAHGDDIDAVLLDAEMPGLSGPETAPRLQEIKNNLTIVMFSTFNQDETPGRCVNAGVSSLVVKGEPAASVAEALLRSCQGETIISAGPTAALLNEYRQLAREQRRRREARAAATNLPRRLQRVYDCLLDGLSNRAIAQRLTISENTVRVYVSQVLQRLGYTSRAQLISATLGE